jgi:hypothetical protein
LDFSQTEPFLSDLAQIEYNVTSLDRHLDKQIQDQDKPFVPIPNYFPNVADNIVASKPVGPHLAAPQYAYRSGSIRRVSSHDKAENPFGEDNDVVLTEAQNSPFVNFQQ